jgi:hypothetical protein
VNEELHVSETLWGTEYALGVVAGHGPVGARFAAFVRDGQAAITNKRLGWQDTPSYWRVIRANGVYCFVNKRDGGVYPPTKANRPGRRQWANILNGYDPVVWGVRGLVPPWRWAAAKRRKRAKERDEAGRLEALAILEAMGTAQQPV